MEKNKTKKLNLGCGKDFKKDYINCDIRKDVKPDVVLDLTKKLPFKENSIDKVYMKHVLEHIPNYDFLIKELYRICKKGAIIHILVPFYTSQNMLPNPHHINYFGYFTLDCYNDLFDINPKINFFIDNHSKLIDFIINKKPYIYQRFFAWTFPASQIQFKLKVLK